MKHPARLLKKIKEQRLNLKDLKDFSALKLRFKKLRIDIRYRLFRLDHKIACHPVLGRMYLKSGLARRVALGMVTFSILLTGFIVLLHPGVVDAAWYSDTWKFRKMITVDYTKVSTSSHTDFPVLISITDSSLAAHAQSTGNDILFTSSDGSTKLSHEIETYTTSSGKLVAWVKIPTLSNAVNTNIYMYYGNSSAADQQDAENVWDSSYVGVWHSGETSGTTLADSSGSNDGAKVSATSPSVQANGKIDGAQTYNGTSDKADVTSNDGLNITNTITMSCWAKPTLDGSYRACLMKSSATTRQYAVGLTASDNWRGDFGTNGAADDSCDPGAASNGISGQWQYVVVTKTGTSCQVYVNGVAAGAAQTLAGATILTSTGFLGLGYFGGGGGEFTKGDLDEIRVSNINRSAGWITTEYNNQNSPATFISTSRTQEQKNAPVLYWNFDEGYGTSAGDASTYNNGGTVSGATWQSKNMCLFDGKCLKFDGSDDKVSRAYSTDTELDPGTASFSLSTWFKHPSAVSGTDVLIARSNGAVDGIGYKVYMNSTGKVCFGIDDDATTFPDDDACSTSTYIDSYWHHIEAVKNGTSSITLYIDGKQVDQDGTLAATATLSGSSPTFYVGIDGNGSSNPWSGFIDEVKYFDYAKSPDQVKADFAAKGSVMGASTVFGAGDAANSVNQGLVGYWPMDDGVGNLCASGVDHSCDLSGNANDGTWTGGTASTSGKFGFATTFDAVDNNINAGSDTTIDNIPNGGGLTISAWIYPQSNGENNAGRIIQKNDGGSNPITGWVFNLDSSNRFTFRAGFDGASQDLVVTTTNTFTANTWQHVTLSWDGSITASNVHIYINGVEAAYTTQTSGTGSYTSDGGQSLYIGNSSTGSRTFDGKLDDVRIYNRPISDREARSLYDWAPGPVGYWKFDERTGTSANDSSGNGLTGTLIDSPKWVAGKVGSGLLFNDTTNIVSVADNTRLEPSDEITYEAWVNFNALDSTDRKIFYKEHSAAPYYGYQLYINTSNQLTCEWQNTSSTLYGVSATSVTLATKTWYHVVCARQGTTLQIFVNGVLANTVATTGTLYNSDSQLAIGSAGAGSSMRGVIDDVRVYNYARTAKQIVQDMNAGHPAVGTPVGSAVGHWSFDDGYGLTAQDKSPLNNDLTLSAAGWINSGKFGKAWNGAGTNWLCSQSGGTCADDDDFDFVAADDFSISIWLKSDSEANPGTTEYIVDKEAGTGYAIYARTNGKVCFAIDSDGSWTPNDEICSVGDKYDKQWHHVVATKVGTSKIQISFDGKLETIDGVITASGTLVNADSLTIGDKDSVNNGNEFNGDIDETKIYRYALNVDEVRMEFNQGKAVVLGARSTGPDGSASNSAARAYCPHGDSSGNCAGTSDPSPVGQWSFDERTGTTVNDTSGRGNTGTWTGSGSHWVAGKIGAAGNFNGTNDYVDAGNSSVLNNTTNTQTVQGWFKINTPGVGQYLVIRGGSGLGGYMLGIDDPCPLTQFKVTKFGVADICAGTVPTDRQWHNIAAVWSSTGVVVYVDGIVSAPTSSDTSNFLTSTSTLRLGSDGSTFSSMLMDDVKIYNYARNQAQVSWDYNGGKPTSWWKFDECTGSTIRDVAWTASGSASRVDGTWSGSTAPNTSAGACSTVDTATAWYNGRTGKFNSALDFDGVDDVVTIANEDKIWLNKGLQNGFAISTWVNADDAGEGSLGQIFNKGTNTYCRTKTPVGSHLDLECSLDLTTADASLTVGNAFDTGGWHNVVLSWTNDGDDEVSVWIDGKLRGTSNNGNGDPAAENNSLYIGNNSAGSATFNGRIDEAMVFSYELTSTLIKTLYNQFAAVRFGPSTGRP